MNHYIVIQNGELDQFKRFSTNGNVRNYIESQINNHGATLDDFLVIKGENMESMWLSQTTAIQVSVGGQ